MKIRTLFMLLILLCSQFLTPEEISRSWQSVLGGEVVAPPRQTSYGFITLSDGRILNASTSDGTVIWRQSVEGRPSPFMTVTHDDFVYITTNDAKKLSLYNPDGLFLWEVDLIKPAIADPLVGRDGRVFVQNQYGISCYGTKGLLKWHIDLPKAGKQPIVEMNDGSILYVLDFTKNNCSVALRVSPFGKKLEEIEFYDIISVIQSYDGGIILGFEKGYVGSCIVENGVTETAWSVENSQLGFTPINIVLAKNSFCVLFSNLLVREYSLETQEVYWEKNLPQYFANNDIFVRYLSQGFCFSTVSDATSLYSFDTKKGGEIAWEKSLAHTEDAFFPFITKTGFLVLSFDNWLLEGYRLQDVSVHTSVPMSKKDYNYLAMYWNESYKKYNIGTILTSLNAGNYGEKEALYSLYIEDILSRYKMEYMYNAPSKNIASKSQVYTTASRFNSSTFNDIVPLILENETEPFYMQLAFDCASNISYDPSNIMLASLDKYYFANKSKLSDVAIISLANAVASICNYMGKASFSSYGSRILFDILESRKEITVQSELQNVLQLFIDFEN